MLDEEQDAMISRSDAISLAAYSALAVLYIMIAVMVYKRSFILGPALRANKLAQKKVEENNG